MPFIKGTVRFCNIAAGQQTKYDEDDEFAAWSIQIEISEEDAKGLEAKGANVTRDKTTGAPLVRFRRKEGRKDKETGEVIMNSPPRVVDENVQPFATPERIGTGSPVYVEYWISKPAKKSYKPGMMLEAVQVDTRTMKEGTGGGFGKIETPLETPAATVDHQPNDGDNPF